jgi:hypothetical protein
MSKRQQEERIRAEMVARRPAGVRAIGRTSRVPIEWHQGYVWTIRDGNAFRFRWFNDRPRR